jgi:hypothetical protein
MPDDHQNERPLGGQWADQQKKGMKKQRQATSNRKHEGGQHVDEDKQQQAPQGDDRTPDKAIGRVAHSQGEKAAGDLKSEKKGE